MMKDETIKDRKYRKARCDSQPEIILPMPSTLSELPKDYPTLLRSVKQLVSTTRTRALVAASAQMTMMYWQIGRMILDRQDAAKWGAKVIDRLSADLKKAFPGLSGFSPRNLKYMRKFAEAWPDESFVQRTVALISWRCNLSLLDKLKDAKARMWYAQEAAKNAWSKEWKDPYVFDFLGIDKNVRERELEDALVAHVEQFLVELGQGFAFVGRQVHVEFEGDDYYMDLLFYHLHLRCFVVVELKVGKFDPGDAAQLGFYQTIVDHTMKHPTDAPTLGLLLVKEKSDMVVRYSLEGMRHPIGVAEWRTQIEKAMPKEMRDVLPTIEQIESEFADEESDEPQPFMAKPAAKKTGRGTRPACPPKGKMK